MNGLRTELGGALIDLVLAIATAWISDPFTSIHFHSGVDLSMAAHLVRRGILGPLFVGGRARIVLSRRRVAGRLVVGRHLRRRALGSTVWCGVVGK